MIQWIIGGAAATAAAGVVRSEYEKKHLKTEYQEIVSPKLTKDRTFVFLSDLHSREFGPDHRELIRAVDAVRPDGIFLGGDMTICSKVGPKGLRDSRSLGRQEDERALKLAESLAARYPVYAGNGNHEERMRWEQAAYGSRYERYSGRLTGAGVRILDNQSADLEGNITVSGLRLGREYYGKLLLRRPYRMPQHFMEESLGKPDKTRFQILMAHSPLYFKEYAAWGADLSLAGHFHGGTIRLPGVGGLMTPQYQFFCPYCGGTFENETGAMIVSRGLGTHSINVRIGNFPQIVVIRLKKGPERKPVTGEKD